MKELNLKSILYLSIITVLIAGLVGMFGMIAIGNTYGDGYALLGWFFAFIPVIILQRFIDWNLNQKHLDENVTEKLS